ncbi:hypothetical protein QA600_13205 [Natronococcus sp. A-GB1]|uniref:hypothetical protein n=1 Tax=Natronococcus sp. A-GB1 TaxID=3037648 RepID=UPI00241EF904|nr:hypothetical protein [Natronococcus sp. A-GB1]MDG5760296.1 hypothetical protein [Natronococcus sp. A-GB1]
MTTKSIGGTTASRRDDRRIDRRTVLRALGVASVPLVSGCFSGDENGDESNDDEGGETSDEPTSNSDDDGTDESERSVGTAEITFLGDTYTDDDASCDGRRTFPPENEMIGVRDMEAGIEFFVERDDPAESDVVEVEIAFPAGDPGETIGEVEAYSARTTVDEIEFELGSGTSGSLHLEPSSHMNDDVEHDPDGGEITWEIAC